MSDVVVLSEVNVRLNECEQLCVQRADCDCRTSCKSGYFVGRCTLRCNKPDVRRFDGKVFETVSEAAAHLAFIAKDLCLEFMPKDEVWLLNLDLSDAEFEDRRLGLATRRVKRRYRKRGSSAAKVDACLSAVVNEILKGNVVCG